MTPTLPPAWQALLKDELQKPYWCSLEQRLGAAYESGAVYPPAQQLFAAFERTPPACVRAVILGQDPYHGPGQAHGLCFSVQPGVQPPPSLQNIFKELQSDLGIVPPKDGTLTKWAERGVLMLNTTLTVRRGQANSHKNLGWTTFTDHIIEKLNEHEQPIVFLLWGGNARSKKKLITAPQHLVLESVHPSPLSAYRGFFGNHHFTLANDYLTKQGKTPINW